MNRKCSGASARRVAAKGAEAQFAAMCGVDVPTYHRERPGMSAFMLWLDRAPKGRNETGVWWRRHDEYGKRKAAS
jgi:predicted dithiol-disulfide oxidoreductase (DUF899 family)